MLYSYIGLLVCIHTFSLIGLILAAAVSAFTSGRHAYLTVIQIDNS